MTQYLLSVFMPDDVGADMSPDEMDAIYKQVDEFNAEVKSSGAWVFAGGLHPASSATVVQGRERRRHHHRRPVRRDQGAARRLLGHRGRRPRRRAGAGPRRRRRPARAPSRSARSRTSRPSSHGDGRPTSRHARSGSESGRAVATLVRLFGDIDIAEEAVQDAFAVAVERWPATGVPPNPGAWITTTARNRAIDRLRRESKRHDRYAQAALVHERDEPTAPVGPREGRPPPARSSRAATRRSPRTSRSP